MTIVPVSLSTSSSQARYQQEGSSRLVNCYAEQTGQEAKAPWTIYPSSGLDVWATATNSGTVAGPTGVRAMLATDDYLYVVAGRDVSAVDPFGAVELIDTLSGDGDVFLASNRRSPDPQICLVADGVGYIITGTTATTISDADLPPPLSVAVHDGYFLFPTTFDRVFISEEDNGSSIRPLDFGRAQRQPDNTLYALGGERDAMIFGERTVEWWANSPDGSGNFPYAPVASINVGLKNAKSVVQLDRAVAFLANDGTIRLLDGYSAQRISTHTVERELAGAGTVYGTGWSEPDTGHAWLMWTSDLATWSYNLRTGLWSERRSFGRRNWRGSCAVQWRGRTLIGDYDDGRIYEVKADYHDEAGEPIIMEVVPPVVHSAPHRIRVNAVHVDAVTGHGGTLAISASSDGGLTYGTARTLDLGDASQRLRNLKTYRFGMFGTQGCTLKLSCSASAARAVSGLALDIDRLSA